MLVNVVLYQYIGLFRFFLNGQTPRKFTKILKILELKQRICCNFEYSFRQKNEIVGCMFYFGITMAEGLSLIVNHKLLKRFLSKCCFIKNFLLYSLQKIAPHLSFQRLIKNDQSGSGSLLPLPASSSTKICRFRFHVPGSKSMLQPCCNNMPSQ